MKSLGTWFGSLADKPECLSAGITRIGLTELNRGNPRDREATFPSSYSEHENASEHGLYVDPEGFRRYSIQTRDATDDDCRERISLSNTLTPCQTNSATKRELLAFKTYDQ